MKFRPSIRTTIKLGNITSSSTSNDLTYSYLLFAMTYKNELCLLPSHRPLHKQLVSYINQWTGQKKSKLQITREHIRIKQLVRTSLYFEARDNKEVLGITWERTDDQCMMVVQSLILIICLRRQYVGQNQNETPMGTIETDHGSGGGSCRRRQST